MMPGLPSANPALPTPTRPVLPCARYPALLVRLRLRECALTALLVPSRPVDRVSPVLQELTLLSPDRLPVKHVLLVVSVVRAQLSVVSALLDSFRIRRVPVVVKSVPPDSSLTMKVLPHVTNVLLEHTMEIVVPLPVLPVQVELWLNMRDRSPVSFARLDHLLLLPPSVHYAPLERIVERTVLHLVGPVPQGSIVMLKDSSLQLALVPPATTARRGLLTPRRASALPVPSALQEVPPLLHVPLVPTSLPLPLLSATPAMLDLTALKRV